MLCDNLYSHYTAKVDFVIKDKDTSISGELDIQKSDGCTLKFTQPEEFLGISVTGDTAGNGESLCFEYAGIPATIPKSLTSRLSMMLSLFSDALPSGIMNLSSDSFEMVSDTRSKESDSHEGTAKVFFSENGISYTVTYNTSNGNPYIMDVESNNISATLTFKEFNIYNKN